jgi:hypothetical protein
MPSALQAIKDQTPASDVSFLDMKARRIKELSQRWSENTIAIGQEFKQVRDSFPIAGPPQNGHRPGWAEWVKRTGWSSDHVSKFIKIAERMGNRAISGNVSFRVLEVLAADAVPEAAVSEVLGRAARGEAIGRTKVREIIRPHLPTRAQAIKEARDTGKLVTARDGFMYSGASEDEIAAYSERRSAVYGIERAFNSIADCPHTPAELIAMAESHWVSGMNLGKLEAAIRFLTKLQPLLEKRQKVVR